MTAYGFSFTAPDGLGHSASFQIGGLDTPAANQYALYTFAIMDVGQVAFPFRAGYFGTSVEVDPSGAGFVDAAAYKVGGTSGLASFSGAVTNITVVNGIVTAAS
jgi:hypothetical protein